VESRMFSAPAVLDRIIASLAFDNVFNLFRNRCASERKHG